MFKRNVVSIAVLTTMITTSAMAATKKDADEQKDSVSSWGPWNGVQTAAGPGAGGNVPLLIQFANAQNMTDGDAFVAGVASGDAGDSNTIFDNSGLRQYQAWTSRKAHGKGKRNSTEQAYFTEFSLDYPGEGEEGEATFTYAIATDAGDQTRSPRVAVDGGEGAFISVKNKGKSAEIVKSVPVSEIEARIFEGGKLPSTGTVVRIAVDGPGHLPAPPAPAGHLPAPPAPAGHLPAPPAHPEGQVQKVRVVQVAPAPVYEYHIVVGKGKNRTLQLISPTTQLVVQQQTGERNVQLARILQGDQEQTFVYGIITGADEERQRMRVGAKDGNKWLYQSKWSKWSGWSEDQLNNQSNFIYGQSSSIASVNSVLSGAQNLTYAGSFIGSKGYVELTLKLGGKASWEGTFNPGNAVPSFRVDNGSFNGVDLKGVVTANPGVASGTVDASFFGNKAQHIGGIADISGHREGQRFVDVFTTTQGADLPK